MNLQFNTFFGQWTMQKHRKLDVLMIFDDDFLVVTIAMLVLGLWQTSETFVCPLMLQIIFWLQLL